MSDTHPQPRADTSEGDVNLSPARRDYEHAHVGPCARELVDRDRDAFLHQALSTPCLGALTSARGCTLTDADGRTFLDFHGNSVHQVGFGHPRVIAAATAQLATLPFCPRRFANEPAVRLAARLAQLTDHELPRVLLAPAGALAMSMALKLARLATGRAGFIAMHGSFHGATLDTIAVGDEAIFREGVGPFMPGCVHVRPCAPPRCGRDAANACTGRCADDVEHIFDRRDDIAAVVAEPIRCTTVDIPPPEYWRRVRDACDRRGALLVFDEVPTCLGRTGRMFAHEHFGIRPDILVIGKGLGGGIFPQAAMLARDHLNVAPHLALGHFTHEKSPVGAAVALATLDVIAEEQLIQRAATIGAAWRSTLARTLTATGVVREVRGVGLLIGVEIDAGSPPRTATLADRALYECLRRGLSLKVSDARVLTLVPPLTVSRAELDQATGTLLEGIAAASRSLPLAEPRRR